MSAKFILIDDDAVNIFLVKRLIYLVFPDASTMAFTNSRLGLEYLKNLKPQSDDKCIVFLDLNMPFLTGWDISGLMAKHWSNIAPSNVLVYILSSSDYPSDKKNACTLPIIKDFLLKPLSVEQLLKIKTEINCTFN